MTDRLKDILTTITFLLIVGILFLLCLISPPKEVSESERRPLAQFPELEWNKVLSASVMKDFSKAASDQLPFRDEFRGLKAIFNNNVLMLDDNNGFYKHEDYIAKNEYRMSKPDINKVTKIMNAINKKLLSDGNHNIIVSLIPDKNHFLYKDSGHLGLDYENFKDYFYSSLEFESKKAEVEPLLEIEDYYYTDTHWRQEKIVDIAKSIVEGFGREYVGSQFTVLPLEDFKGVYAGQSALPYEKETLYYLTNKTMENCKVQYMDANADWIDTKLYPIEQFTSMDQYNVFLNGPQGLITIENPENTTGNQLVVFRDSFGSSISPLFAESYSKVILIDLRYVETMFLDKLISFSPDADVLFLFSTLAINSSDTFNSSITR